MFNNSLSLAEKAALHKHQKQMDHQLKMVSHKCNNLVLRELTKVPRDKRSVSFSHQIVSASLEN